MGYRKVYLTKEEEVQLQFIQDCRAENREPRSAYNAILKEGLALVFQTYAETFEPDEPKVFYGMNGDPGDRYRERMAEVGEGENKPRMVRGRRRRRNTER